MMGNRGLEIWERWSDSEYVLKVALTGYAGGLNVGHEERTQRGLECFGLGHLEEKALPFTYLRETRRSRWVEDGQKLDSGHSTFERLIRCPLGDVKWGLGFRGVI